MSRDRDREGLLDWFSRRLNLTEIFSLLTSYGLFYAELDTGKPLRRALAEARSKAMPSYARWPRVLGLLVVLLLAVEFLTGGLLTLYYLPTPDAARDSLGTILSEVRFGSFVHQIHFFGAQLLLAILMVRLVRFFAQRVYQEPRELLWVFAVLLLLVCFHLDLAGRALTMTAPRYWSTVRALEVVGSVPIYGSLLVFLLGGEGSGVGDLTLIRFYVLHVAVLPFLALCLIYLHFSGIRRLGLREAKGEITATATFHRHLLNLAILLVVLFGVLVSLAVLTPVPFNPAADPYSTPPGVGPPWYLLAPFGFLEWTAGLVPRWVAGSVLFLAFTALIALPFWDRSRPGSAARLLIWGLAALSLLGWIALTVYGARVA